MKNIIAIDIGGTNIKYGVIDYDGKIKLNKSIKTRVTQDENFILEDIDNLIFELTKNFDISGVAISTAGVVCSKTGIISYAGPTIPNYKGTDFIKLVREKYNLPCTVENDVNSAALGEFWKGAGESYDSGFCITVGTGLGGALIINNELIKGASDSAGEIGYMKIHGIDIQKIASTTALIEAVAKRKNIAKEEINGQIIFDLAKSGDVDSIIEINNLIENICKAIENIVYIVNPEVIILGGGIMEQRMYLEPLFHKKIKEVIPEKFISNTKIEFATLGNNAGMVGALYKFKSYFNER